MSNSLDPDQARFVGPGLDPNCLQMFSADDTGKHRFYKFYAINLTSV